MENSLSVADDELVIEELDMAATPGDICGCTATDS